MVNPNFRERRFQMKAAIDQIISVTHSEAFAEKAEHVIRVEKQAGVSIVSSER